MIDPDYPNVVISFRYRDFEIKIARDKWQGQDIYTAWADYSLGSAVAVPFAITTKIAIRNAKRWVDQRMQRVTENSNRTKEVLVIAHVQGEDK